VSLFDPVLWRLKHSRLFERLPVSTRRRVLFRLAHGYALPRVPRALTEKIQWRIIHDRRPLIAIGGDKLRMKEYAATRSDRVRIAETLWSGEDLASIADHDFGPGRWILKPISSSQFIAFGEGSLRSSGIDLDEIGRWKADAPVRLGEWAYTQGRPGYLIERRIEVPGDILDDFRCYVFDGRLRMIMLSTRRRTGTRPQLVSPTWEPMPFRAHARASGEEPEHPPAPENLAELVGIAEELGAEYDFIRVDLYNTPEGIWFGELTPYPGGGLGVYDPPEADFEVGSWWSLPRL